MADVSQDRRVTVLIQGRKRSALSEGSRLCWALPSPVHERSGYRASRPTGYKVMRLLRIIAHGPVRASHLANRRTYAHCGRTIVAPSSSRSRSLTRRLRRWPPANLDRASPQRQRPPPTNDALLTTHSPYKDEAFETHRLLRPGNELRSSRARKGEIARAARKWSYARTARSTISETQFRHSVRFSPSTMSRPRKADRV